MARAGQSSPGAALRYLHEVDGRQREIADRLAVLATAGRVTPNQGCPEAAAPEAEGGHRVSRRTWLRQENDRIPHLPIVRARPPWVG